MSIAFQDILATRYVYTGVYGVSHTFGFGNMKVSYLVVCNPFFFGGLVTVKYSDYLYITCGFCKNVFYCLVKEAFIPRRYNNRN